MEEPKEEPQPEDPAIAEYRASGDADMGAASKLSYQHELNIIKNSSTANEETNKLIKTALGENHELVPEFSDNDALTIKRPNNEYILAVRGTRITNISDLISDEQILVGANVNRFDKIEKVYTGLRTQNPNAKITVTGHSLGGYVAKHLADKYEFKDKKLDMVGFDVATSPIHIGMAIAGAVAEPELIPGMVVKGVAGRVSNYVKHALIGASEYGKHRTYSTDTFDAISVMNNITNFDDEVKTLPQRVSRSYWFGSHSPNNYILEPKQTAAKAYILKTEQGNKKFYTTPQIQIKKETGDFKQDLSDKSRDYCSLNPNSQRCKIINKKL
jgi:triacylglycerol esterase/lipase EstA (alpha/beta hydrolase family)